MIFEIDLKNRSCFLYANLMSKVRTVQPSPPSCTDSKKTLRISMKISWANCWKGHKVTFGAPWKDPKDKLMLIPMFWRFQKSIRERWKRKFELTSPCEKGDP